MNFRKGFSPKGIDWRRQQIVYFFPQKLHKVNMTHKSAIHIVPWFFLSYNQSNSNAVFARTEYPPPPKKRKTKKRKEAASQTSVLNHKSSLPRQKKKTSSSSSTLTRMAFSPGVTSHDIETPSHNDNNECHWIDISCHCQPLPNEKTCATRLKKNTIHFVSKDKHKCKNPPPLTILFLFSFHIIRTDLGSTPPQHTTKSVSNSVL